MDEQGITDVIKGREGDTCKCWAGRDWLCVSIVWGWGLRELCREELGVLVGMGCNLPLWQ